MRNDAQRYFENILLITVDAPVFMAVNDYTFSEDGPLSNDVCVEIRAPADGLEIDLTATLNVIDGLKAGTSITFTGSVCDIFFINCNICSSSQKGV